VTSSLRLTGHRRLRYAAVALVAATAVATIWTLGPRLATPPQTITLATGPNGGAYAELGPRYQRILARNGITLRLLPTGGDVDNLLKLRDPKSGVSVAFVQAGIATEAEKAGLLSLGTLMYSPLWLFEAGDHQGFGLADLAGKRVSIGREGSGTRFQALKLLSLVGVDPKSLRLVADTPAEGEQALLRGELDALAINASWDAPAVRRLLADLRARLINFPRADAYFALNPYLNKLVVPMGVGDLAKNLPPADVTLLATKTSLLIWEDVHPALQYLLLEAASEIHAGPSLFQHAGQFPAGEPVDVPLSPDARHFYKSGPLPFWLAVLVERLLILFIPLVGLLYPVLQVLPDLYYRAMERRVLALYGELKLLEAEVDRRTVDAGGMDLAARIDALEAKASALRVPMKVTQSLYHLKEHINLVPARIARQDAELRPTS
jgi:TRAP transporter TAXI family solute receptor